MTFRSPAWKRFRANRRGWISLWTFVALYAVSLCSELVSSDRPLWRGTPFASGPHTVWDASEIEPWLRPVRQGGGRKPVAAAEFAPGAGCAPLLVRSWGDTGRFADAGCCDIPGAVSVPIPKSDTGARLADGDAEPDGRDRSGRRFLRLQCEL